MSELKYSKDHTWARLDADGAVTVGITDYAQQQLGDVVYVDLPVTGRVVERGQDAAVVESVKSASDVKMPIGGTVIEVNAALADEPGLVNAEPTGGGWLFKLMLADAGEIDGLLDEKAYDALTAAEPG